MMRLNRQLNNGRISLEDVRKIYRDMKLSDHNFPTKPSSDGYYHTWVTTNEKGGRKQLKAKTLEDLKDKTFELISDCGSFKYVFEKMLEQKLLYVRDPEKVLSVRNNISRIRSDYNRFIAGTDFEHISIDLIDKNMIEDLCLCVLRSYDLKSKAFMNFRCLLSMTFKYAYEEYLILDNPYTRINFSKYTDLTLRPTPISKRYHSDEEISAILDEIHRHQALKPNYIPAYALELQMCMGLRRGEIPPLEWTDITDGKIYLTKELITVKKEKGPQDFEIVHHTKNYKDRWFFP